MALGTAKPTYRSPDVLVTAAIVASAPLVLLLFNRDWFFSQEGWLDPWQYVALFRQYLNPNFGPGVYKLARLPWILSGFLLNRALPPLAAAFVLHALFLSATSLALFVGLYALFERLALAAVVAVALGFYTHGHGSGGWDYHNTAAGAFYLAAFMLLALPPVVAGRWLPLMIAGAMIAVAVHADITLVNFLPALAFVHLCTVRSRLGLFLPLRTLLVRAAIAAAGGVLVTILLGAINWLAGREFFFFMPLVRMVTAFVTEPRNQLLYYHPWGQWLFRAKYLILPAAMFVSGTAALVWHVRSRSDALDVRAALIVQFVVMALVWTAWQAAGQTALDPNYVAHPLIPSFFIAMGGLLARGWPDACERHWFVAVSGTVVLCTLCVAGVFGRSLQTGPPMALAMIGGVVFAAGLVAYVWRPVVVTAVAAIAAFAIANGLASARPLDYASSDPCKIEPDIYSGIVESSDWIGRLDPTYSRVRTWFDEREEIRPTAGCSVRMGALGSSIAMGSFLPYVTKAFPMPRLDEVPDVALKALASDEAWLAIFSNTSAYLDRWNQRLASLGLSSSEVARHVTTILDSQFSIHIWKIALRSPESLTFASPIIAVTDQTPQQLNVYGTPPGRLTADGGRVVFAPTDARDHVAYPFVRLSTLASDSWARVVVESAAPASPTCRLFVQADDFTTLATLGCSSATRLVLVPIKTQRIRIYLADATRRPFVLPTKIELALPELAR